MAGIILIVVVISVVAIFSVQNATPVSIAFLFWRFDASLAIVLFLAVLGGGLTALVVVYSLRFKKNYKKKKHAEGSGGADEDHVMQ